MNPSVIFPDNPRSLLEDIAGRKGALLSRLVVAGFPTPPFFIVTTEAPRGAGGCNVGDELREEIAAALRSLELTEAPLAVRVSSVHPAAADHPPPQGHGPVVEVRGVEAVTRAIEECWRRSGSTESDFAAESDAGPDSVPESSALAVLVQRLVEGEYAGTVWYANPTTLNLSETLIHARSSFSDGTSYLSESSRVAITLSSDDGQVRSVDPDPPSPVLPSELIDAVWHLVEQISRDFHYPHEVDWIWGSATLHLVDARPIAPIGDVYYSRFIEPWRDSPDARPDDPSRLWSRAYADDIWASPVSPLFYTVQNLTGSFTGYWKWHHDPGPLPPDIFKYFRASAYVDVAILRRQYAYHPRLGRVEGILHFFPRSMQQMVKDDRWLWKGRLWRTAHFELQDRKTRSLFENDATLRALWPSFLQRSNQWFRLDLTSMSLTELRAHQGEVGAVTAAVGPACGFAVAYHAHDLTFVLTGLLERWFGEGDRLYAEVTSGLDDSETVREADSLWQLAQVLRECSSDLLRLAHDGELAAFRTSAANEDAGRAFIRSFDRFWEDHQHRGASYKDLIYPRWGDEPGMLLAAVVGYMESSVPRPTEAHEVMRRRRQQTQARLLDRCRGAHRYREPILRGLFHYNEIYMSQRDNHRYYFDRVWYQLRRIYRALGVHLCGAGTIAAADDVFYLGANEIENALAGKLSPVETHERVRVRRVVWEATLHSQAPKFLRGYAPYDDRPPGSSDETILRGIGASPGQCTGRARIIRDVKDVHLLEDGEVLVTRQTDPAWSLVFARISGLILETGGVLAHGASLCREYNIPCVTGVEGATIGIPERSMVSIDGVTGTVQILAADRDTNTATDAAIRNGAG